MTFLTLQTIQYCAAHCSGKLCRYQFGQLLSPLGTPGLLHGNVCSVPGLLHNRKCPGARPINDDVFGAGHLHQQAFKHENCCHSHLGFKN